MKYSLCLSLETNRIQKSQGIDVDSQQLLRVETPFQVVSETFRF